MSLETDLDVGAKYKELVATALDSEGVYIRTREVLQELFEDSGLTFKEKSEMTANVIGSLNYSIVNAAMQTALQWESTNKELYMKKEQLNKEIELLAKKIEIESNAVNESKYNAAIKEAELKKVYGLYLGLDGSLTQTATDGKLDKELKVMAQDLLNKEAEEDVLKSKLKETNAALHKIIADTYENYGYYTYAIGDTGVTSVSKLSTHNTLSDYQKDIAKEQAKGYAWNAWSNAAQSSASFLATAISSDMTDNMDGPLNLWTNAVTKLNGVVAPTT